MKTFFILAALACVASAATINGRATTEPESFKQLKRQIMSNVYSRLSRGSVIPPFDDPHKLNDTTLNFNNELLVGTVSLVNGVANGLSTLVDDIGVNLITLKITVDVTLTRAQLTGQYTAAGEANLPSSGLHLVQGAGDLDASIEGLVLHATATLGVNLITNRASVKNLAVDLSFTGVHAVATGANVDGAPVDWEAVNQDAMTVWADIWLNYQSTIEDEAEKAINEVLHAYTLAELIDLITGAKRHY